MVNVAVHGVGFRDTAVSYLEPHGMPSGGDWALQRTAAVVVQGTEHISFDGCTFLRLDGNGVLVSGYARNTTITRSEFAWTGATAIAQWGDTSFGDNGGDNAVKGMGWDGRGGEQPRFTTISFNLIHELGIWEKQSAAYFQAKSCQNTIEVVFNLH